MDDSILQIVDLNYEYRKKNPKYEFHSSKWKFLSKQGMGQIFERKFGEDKRRAEIFVLMEFWNLHLINDFEISFLLEPVRFKNKNDLEENDLMKYYEQVDGFYDETKPVNVYISYPFSVDLEFRVYPINQIGRRTFKLLPIGYLAWQVSKLFEKLFNLGVDGLEISGLTELQLTSFRVFASNNFILEVSS